MADFKLKPEEIKALRQKESWLNSFDLSDEDFYQVIVLSSRAVIGTDSLDDFYQKMSDSIKKDHTALIKIIEAVVNNRFLPQQDGIEGLDDFIKKLGGKVPPTVSGARGQERKLKPDDTAKMVFSSTDEEEIKALPKVDYQVPSVGDYSAQAQAIMDDFGFKDKDEVIVKRLQNLIVAKLRNVRDDIEMLEVLTKNSKIGGIGLDEEKARFLIKLIKDKESGLETTPLPVAAPAAAQRVEFPIYQELEEKKSSAKAASAAPITLAEKRDKDGFARQDAGSKAQEIKKEMPAPPPPAVKPQPPLPTIAKEPATVKNLPVDIQALKKKETAKLLPKEEVYPIIEEEDGLPVIRMPDEVMVSPVASRQPSQTKQEITPKKQEIIQPVAAKTQNVPITPIISEEPKPAVTAAPEVVVPKTEPAISKKPTELPPANPQPYIAPTKTLPPKTPMMSARRPSLDDVKFVRKLVGPVEELETMTLIDFRRISPDPVAAVKKIKEKIGLLEKELYSKRAEGITAWHKSEVSRFYRLLGQASMAEGRSVEEVIAERQQAGKPTLTLAEFNAIMELNKELRY